MTYLTPLLLNALPEVPIRKIEAYSAILQIGFEVFQNKEALIMSMEINNVTSQIMELKTSKPGVTRKEEIKTGFKNVDEYSKYLQEKYDFMNTGTTSMQGIPTTVSVSSTFLKKCMDDPEKAAYLEENLAAIPDCVKALKAHTSTMPGNPVCTYATYQIDANGNISCMSGCTNDPDGKIAKENAEKKAKENREKQEKLEEKRQERTKERKEQLEKLLASGKNEDFSITITGTDIKEITSRIITRMSVSGIGYAGISFSGFDVKA